MPKRHYGWLRQKPDHRDIHFLPTQRMIKSVAPSLDLSTRMGPQLDQSSLGACGPNTGDELIEFDEKLEGDAVVSASRLFIYYTTRVLMGTVGKDSGVDNRTMLKALAASGYCSETAWPYDIAKFTQKPPESCFTAALANRIKNYALVSQSLPTMQATIATGHIFMFGFECFQQLESEQAAANGIVAMPAAKETPIGGHDVSFCGYNATSGTLPGVKSGNVWPAGTWKFRNHWLNEDGTPWGDGGYGYIPFAYSTNPKLSSDFWVINAVPALMGPAVA